MGRIHGWQLAYSDSDMKAIENVIRNDTKPALANCAIPFITYTEIIEAFVRLQLENISFH